MTHISPWAATVGLIQGAAKVLQPDGILFVYGPFLVNGEPTTPSNAAFDQHLRSQNPEWGYRDVAALEAVAEDVGMKLVDKVDMPANNFSLIFKRK